MLYLIVFIIVIFSIILLILGLSRKKTIYLLILNFTWWACALFSAYFVIVAFKDRAYSENWALIDLIIFSLPIILLTLIMLAIELFFLYKNKMLHFSLLTASSISLAVFLIVQLIVGAFSF